MKELDAVCGFTVRDWGGESLRVSPAGSPCSLVLAGHGSETHAELGNGFGRSLIPSAVCLPRGGWLYLLGCYQGREDLREQWARGSGLPIDCVQGAEGETETLLSTLFLMHCAMEGTCGVGRVFGEWVLANRVVRPHFAEARRLYARTGGDPLAVLDFLERAADLSQVGSFLSFARRRPEFLTGLLPAEGRL
jgi:hypothetical protein